MITMEDVRNAKLEELFLATIERELDWEEAEAHTEPVEGFRNGMNVSELLRYAAKNQLGKRTELSEENILKNIRRIKRKIPRGIAESYITLLLKKDGMYFDILTKKELDNEYKIKNIRPLSKYVTEEDVKIREDDDGLALYIEDFVFPNYCKDVKETGRKLFD